MTTPTSAAELVTAAAQPLRQQAEARKAQLAHAKRTVAIGRARNGEPFIVQAESEVTATEAQDVTVIN